MVESTTELPQTGDKGIYLKQQLEGKLIEHREYICRNGQDMPEILNWKWKTPGNKNVPRKNWGWNRENGQSIKEINPSNR